MSGAEILRSPMLGLPIEIVPPGTEIAHAETGHRMIVNDSMAVLSGGHVYMTRRVYELASTQSAEGRQPASSSASDRPQGAVQ